MLSYVDSDMFKDLVYKADNHAINDSNSIMRI